jgi:DNA-binding GntR family transcriptional regulator
MPTKAELEEERSSLISACEDALDALDDGDSEGARQILMELLGLQETDDEGE